MDEPVHSPSVGLGLEGVWGWLLMDGGSYSNCRKPHTVNSVMLFRGYLVTLLVARLQHGSPEVGIRCCVSVWYSAKLAVVLMQPNIYANCRC
jgi:hypothetical protein